MNAGASGHRAAPARQRRARAALQRRPPVTAYELDFFGRVRNLSEAALAQYLATEEGAQGSADRAGGGGGRAYLALLADDELLAADARRR